MILAFFFPKLDQAGFMSHETKRVLTKTGGMIVLGCILMFMFPFPSWHVVGLPALNMHVYVACFVNKL